MEWRGWRRLSRAFIVGITVLTLGVALVTGHVGHSTGTHSPTTVPSLHGTSGVCVRTTPSQRQTPGGSSAIKCPL